MGKIQRKVEHTMNNTVLRGFWQKIDLDLISGIYFLLGLILLRDFTLSGLIFCTGGLLLWMKRH